MAPKQPLGNPSPVSSSEDDEEVSSDEEIVMKLEAEKPEEEDEDEKEEDEKEEEEEKEDEEPLVKDKPIAHESKAVTPELTKKRHTETPILPESRKKNKTGSASFIRIWSDEDVIAVLEGMPQFKKEKGTDPSTDMAGFLAYIKDAIHISVSKIQMSEKIRSLKKKYHNNARREQNGEDLMFSKPHDQNTYRLSKLIWGSIADKSKTCATNLGKSLDADEFWTTYPCLNKSMESVPLEHRSSAREAMKSGRRSKVKDMDDKWYKFNMKEYGLGMKRTQLYLEVSQAIGFGQGS